MKIIRILAALLFALLFGSSAAYAVCSPSTVANTTGTTLNRAVDLLQLICDNGGGGGGGGGAITAASGSYASGAMSAGSYAAGALAAGAFAAGAGVDGWDLTQGTKADAPCTLPATTTACSAIALWKAQANAMNSAIPAGTALIGDVNLRQGGTALSATNGIFSNLLQGNAVISATNGLYNNLLQGNAVISATNGIYANLLVGNVAVATGTGAVGSTVPRFAQATDTATVAGTTPAAAGLGATGATTPSGAQQAAGTAQSAEATAVTSGQLKALVTDLVGKLIVLPYANPENFVSGVITSAMTGTTSTSLVASPGGSLRNYITACTFSNAHATQGTDIILQDGSGGTTLWTVPAAAVYGGAHITFPTPLRQPTAATALFAANVTTGASTKASCSGYKGL